jgi:hypothetical protein
MKTMLLPDPSAAYLNLEYLSLVFTEGTASACPRDFQRSLCFSSVLSEVKTKCAWPGR